MIVLVSFEEMDISWAEYVKAYKDIISIFPTFPFLPEKIVSGNEISPRALSLVERAHWCPTASEYTRLSSKD
jgi:hypothetical protein